MLDYATGDHSLNVKVMGNRLGIDVTPFVMENRSSGHHRKIRNLARSFSKRPNDCTYTHLASAVCEVLCSLSRCSEEGLGRVWAESHTLAGVAWRGHLHDRKAWHRLW